jgi:hypothetical protein
MGFGRPERSISLTEWLIASDEAALMSSGESGPLFLQFHSIPTLAFTCMSDNRRFVIMVKFSCTSI